MLPHIRMPLWRQLLVAYLIIFGISIFSFETSAAAKTPTPTPFYHGEPMPVKTTNQKPQAKKRKKKKKKLYISEDINVLPVIALHEIRGCWGNPRGQVGIIAAIMSDSLTPESSIATRLSATPRTKTPELPSKPIFPKMEFILPGILIGRKKKRSVV